MNQPKAEHTGGTWRVEVWDYPNATPPRKELNVQNETHLIATLAWDENQDNPYTIADKEARANAKLIAAAPDLLAACKKMYARLAYAHESGVFNQKHADALQLGIEAIGKAESK